MRAIKIMATLFFAFSLVNTSSAATNMDGGLLPNEFGHWIKLQDNATGVMYRVNNKSLQGRKNIVFVCQYSQVNITPANTRIAEITGNDLFSNEARRYIISKGFPYRDAQQEVTWVIGSDPKDEESIIYVKNLLEPYTKAAIRCHGSVQ